MHNMSAHQLPEYYQLQWILFTAGTANSHVIEMSQSNMSLNIAKLLTHSRIMKNID